MTLLEANFIDPVLEIKYKVEGMKVTDGQYVDICCPRLGFEWHPFTISSAEGDQVPGMPVVCRLGKRVQPPPSVSQSVSTEEGRCDDKHFTTTATDSFPARSPDMGGHCIQLLHALCEHDDSPLKPR